MSLSRLQELFGYRARQVVGETTIAIGIATTMVGLDSRKVELRTNGLAVSPLTVAGVLAEEALQLNQTGHRALHMLKETDLPGHVKLNLDGRRQQLVLTYPEDRTRALKVAGEVLVTLHRLGVAVVGVRRPVKMSGNMSASTIS